jgi:hypothetical protein
MAERCVIVALAITADGTGILEPSPSVHDGSSPKSNPDSGHMLQRLTRAGRTCQFR